jgi:mannose-1-phosphate guanylyltransferase
MRLSVRGIASSSLAATDTSDHNVEDEDMLAESLRQATTLEALASNKITFLGMSPNAPDSGFGYISPSPDSGVGMRPA